MRRQILHELIISPEEARAIAVPRGRFVRVRLLDGPSGAEVTFLNRQDVREGYHAGQSLLLDLPEATATLGQLTHLYTRPPFERLMATVVEDNAGPHLVWCGGCCSPAFYQRQDPTAAARRSCQETLAAALAPWRVPAWGVPDTLKLFLQSELAPDGTLLGIRPTRAAAGAYLDLRAEMDLIAAVAVCPLASLRSPTVPGRIKVEIWVPEAVSATTPSGS